MATFCKYFLEGKCLNEDCSFQHSKEAIELLECGKTGDEKRAYELIDILKIKKFKFVYFLLHDGKRILIGNKKEKPRWYKASFEADQNKDGWFFGKINRSDYSIYQNGIRKGSTKYDCENVFPGGGLEDFDKDFISGAIRELKEETGIDVSKYIDSCIQSVIHEDLYFKNERCTFGLDIYVGISLQITKDELDLFFNQTKKRFEECEKLCNLIDIDGAVTLDIDGNILIDNKIQIPPMDVNELEKVELLEISDIQKIQQNGRNQLSKNEIINQSVIFEFDEWFDKLFNDFFPFNEIA